MSLPVHSVHPAVDTVLWLRFLLGVVVVLGVPGWLLVRRHTVGQALAPRIYFALAAGLVASVGVGHTLAVIGWAPGLPLAWSITVVLAIAANHWLRPRAAGVEPHGPGPWIWLPCALVAAGHLYGLRDMVAPPHIHDAANHAYMTWQIVETGSMASTTIFAEVTPLAPYFAGWHWAAALISRISGVAPYVATWFLPLLTVVLLPLAASTLWTRWGATGAGLGLAALFVATGSFVPTSILGWGGFGTLVGLFLVPAGARLLAHAAQHGGRWNYAAAGAFLAILAHIHLSEVVAVALLGAFTLWRAGAWRRPTASEALALLAGLALVVDPQMFTALAGYRELVGGLEEEHVRGGLLDSLYGYLLALGKPDIRVLAATVGLGWALWSRRWRPVAVASLGLGLWYVALAVWRDPISTALATPFYRQPARVLYLQVFFLPLLAGLAWVALARVRREVGVVVALLLLWFLGAGVRRQASGLADQRQNSPFSEQEYALARGLGDALGEGALVANSVDDGSVWAMHVSGVPFLHPLSWRSTTASGLELPDDVLSLREDPWPARAQALRRAGVTHVYTSRVVYGDEEHLLSPGNFEGDPRFGIAAANGDAVVWQVRWDAAGP